MKLRLPLVLFGLATMLAACTGEEAVPIDLRATTTSTTQAESDTAESDTAESDSADSEIDEIYAENDAQQQIAVNYAEQQCLDDLDLEEGYIQIVEPESGDKVGEIIADCEEVRSR